LNPNFSEKYQNIFWIENIFEEDGKYVTYGSDFAQYYIPFYHFLKQTKVVIGRKQIYVYEYFPAKKEGPVSYNSHYEGLLLKKFSGEWKVDQYLNQAPPKSILKSTKKIEKKQHHFFTFINFKPLLF
jgi:hypothetical protein